MQSEIAQRLYHLQEEISKASAQSEGGQASDVLLIAVSKTFSSHSIVEAFQAGQRAFGESYVQEAREKFAELPDLLGVESLSEVGFEYHFVGGLQRNKVKHAVGMFDLIHSVDRLELAREISRVAQRRSICQRILLQVNVSGEANKAGVELLDDDCSNVVSLCSDVLALPSLKLEGLMAIGSRFAPSEGSETALVERRRAEFRKLCSLREHLEKECSCRLPELSMGMSTDFVCAIEEGSTMVRIGTSVFGSR